MAKSISDSFLLQDPNHGILYVAAAGNDYGLDITNRILFAKENDSTKDLMIVGALDGEQKTKADYSNFNPARVDLFAPGTCVCGLGKASRGNTGQINGTSQATPIVSAAAALLASDHPEWLPAQIKWRLISTSAFIEEFDGYSAGGVLDLQEAMKTTFRLKTSSEKMLDVTSIDFSDPMRSWNILLSPVIEDNFAHNILRLHRLAKCDSPKNVCFKRYIVSKPPEKLSIPASDELSVIADGKRLLFKAEEIRDIFMTIDQTLANAQLSARP